MIGGLKNLLKTKKSELFKKRLTTLSVDQLNHEIDQATTESENERITSSVDLKEKIRNGADGLLDSIWAR
jgi:hypothetical protein